MKSNSLKRVLALLLVLCMTFSIAVSASAAEGDPSAALSLEVTRSGNTVTAVVGLKEASIALSGVDFNLNFDKSKLTYVGATEGEIFEFGFDDADNITPEVINKDGCVFAMGISMSGDTTKTGELGTFIFTINDEATGNTTLSISSGSGTDTNAKSFDLTLPAAKTFDLAAYKQFDIDSANMTLGNNLAMNFYLDPAYLEAGKDYYAMITKTYADGRPDAVVIVNDDDWGVDASDGFNYFTLDMVAAKEMADTVYVVVYRDEAVDIAVSNQRTDSVRAYAERALKKEEGKTAPDADKLALYVDLLNYGAEAQKYFDYNENDLANKNLTAAQLGYGLKDVALKNECEKDDNYAGMDLVLKSNIILDFYFKNIPADHNNMYAIATYTNHYGDSKVIRVEGEEFLQDPKDGCWYIPVEGLVVADCRQLVTVRVYDGNNNVIAMAKDSVSSYIARISDASPLYVAIMKFAISAYNSFH